MREVVLLGSTGSIGTQTVDVVSRNPDRFRVTGVAAGGGNVALLAEQAARLRVAAVAVADEGAVDRLRAALQATWPGDVRPPQVLAGPDSVVDLAGRPADVVLNAVAGAQGLPATLAAITTGAAVALANKESLIAGGPLVLDAAAPGQLRPVDSEHSAIAQCLRGGAATEVRRLVVTASGGPFRGRSHEDLHDVTPDEALAHPTWDMGRLVTTNSATLVNKGLEVIEAHLLFGVDYDDIEVVVHPQSIVHSMVEFVDGSTIAQASPPDMRLTISLALGWPDRVADAAPAMDWTAAQAWTFEPLDPVAFPAVELAKRAGRAGGWAPAVYNAANEAMVELFHSGRCAFPDIVDTVGAVLDTWLNTHHTSQAQPGTVDDVLAADRWARTEALSISRT